MEFFDVIKDRKSHRAFSEKAVQTCVVERIVEAGLWAPSAHNSQPWYVIASSGEIKDKLVYQAVIEIEELAKYGFKVKHALRSTRILMKAPIVLFILKKQIQYFDAAYMQLEKRFLEYSKRQNDAQILISIGTAIENMLLTIEALGLKGVCISEICFAVDFATKYFLNYQTDTELVSTIAFGYPQNPTKADKYIVKKNLQETCTFLIDE